MSWASHNPEKYEEVERSAVASLVEKHLRESGFDAVDRDTVNAVVLVLQEGQRKAFDELLMKADLDCALAAVLGL